MVSWMLAKTQVSAFGHWEDAGLAGLGPDLAQLLL